MEEDIKKGVRDEDGKLVGKPQANGAVSESLSVLFDQMKFHPKVIEASKSLSVDGHYAPAIFEAFKAVECFVKEKSGQTTSGKELMSRVFREDAPIIKLNELKDQTDKDEQEGFKFLFMGAMVGIRNPKAHAFVKQTDPFITLEYLGFASMLLKRIDFWRIGG